MKRRKALLSAVLVTALAVVMAAASPVSAAETENMYFGDIDIAANSGLGIVSISNAARVDGTPIGNPVDTTFSLPDSLENPTKATFHHKILDQNGAWIATMDVVIQLDGSEVTGETADISSAFAGFRCTTAKSGSNGSVSVYFNGENPGTFRYSVS